MGLIPDRLHWRLIRRTRLLSKRPDLRIDTGSYLLDAVHLGQAVTVEDGAVLNHTTIGAGSQVSGRISHATLGNWCNVHTGAVVGGLGRHPVDQISTHAAFYSSGANAHPGLVFHKSQRFHDEIRPTTIGHDVWIGVRAIILNGVHIGNGAIIDHHAVVTRDVPPFGIVRGVPGKVDGQRFSPSLAAAMTESQWWLWPVDQVRGLLAACSGDTLDLQRWHTLVSQWGPQ